MRNKRHMIRGVDCKIGLVSISRDRSCYMIIGEIYDKTVRENIDILSEFKNDMTYFTSFKVNITNGKVVLYDPEEFSELRRKYKLTQKPYLAKNINKNILGNFTQIFSCPILYDISCMVELFQKIHQDKMKTKISDQETIGEMKNPLYKSPYKPSPKMFILFPYSDPVIRGKIIDACRNISHEFQSYPHDTHFCVVGSRHRGNKTKTSILTTRYLLKIGIPRKNIINSVTSKFPNNILDSLDVINFLHPNTPMDIYLGVKSQEVSLYMTHIRLWNKLGLLTNKVRAITY